MIGILPFQSFALDYLVSSNQTTLYFDGVPCLITHEWIETYHFDECGDRITDYFTSRVTQDCNLRVSTIKFNAVLNANNDVIGISVLDCTGDGCDYSQTTEFQTEAISILNNYI